MDDSFALLRRASQVLLALGVYTAPAWGQAGEAVDGTQDVEEVEPRDGGEASAESGGAAEGGEAAPAAGGAGAPPERAGEGQEGSSDQAPADEDQEESLEEEVEQKERAPGQQAIDDTPSEAHIEDQDDWLKWPFSAKNQKYPRQEEPHRWASAGGFVGWVSRPSGSSSIKYRPGIAWGGYLRPELVSWMGLRLFYREERIPVQVEPGAFDFDEDTYADDFEQPDIELLNLGARLEPTLVVHPRFRVRGIFGWSWVWFRAPFPKSDDFELKRTFRSAVQMDFSFGAGLSLDIIENWVDISLDAAYSVPAGRTGSAYERAQIVRDGEMKHIAPLPELQNSTDVLISLGVIF